MLPSALNRVLLIGAGGQDSNILAGKYKAAGWEVVGVSNPRNRERSARSETLMNKLYDQIFAIDLSVKIDCANFLNFLSPSSIIHAATLHVNSNEMENFAKKNEETIYKVTYTMMENVLQWQEENEASKSLFLGSAQIFGNLKGPLQSNSKHSPENVYAQIKSYTTRMIQEKQVSGVDARVAILFPHTSPMSEKLFLFQEIAKQIRKNDSSDELIIKLRNSRVQFDISDARDVASWLYSFLEFGSKGQNCVFGSGRLIEVRDIIARTMNLMKKSHFRIIDEYPKEEIYGYSSISEMQAKIPNWKRSRTPEETLIDVINFIN